MKSILLITNLLALLLFISCKEEQKKSDIVPKEKILVAADFSIIKPWIRPGAEGRNTACFFMLKSRSENPDTIISASSDLAEIVEVHETYEDEEGKKGMRHIEKLAIEPKSTVEFRPMGYHIMLIGLKKDLPIGVEEQVSIRLKKYGKITFKALVTDSPRF